MPWVALGPLGMNVYYIQHCVSQYGFPTHKHEKRTLQNERPLT